MRLDALVVLLGLMSSASAGHFYLHFRLSEEVTRQYAVAERGRDGTASDIVFVIDTTKSMAEALPPVKEAVSEFLAAARRSGIDPARKNEDGGLRTGLLFYQDRKIGNECELDYITRWQVPLSDDAGPETVDRTVAELNAARATTCGSDEEEEAVSDALVQAISHPRWRDGAYRLLVLIGDAGPHPPEDTRKNPMRYDRADILKLADQYNVRILAVQIRRDPYQDVSAFQSLATGRRDDLKGRFVAVAFNAKAIRDALTRALSAEWNERAR